MNGFGTESVRCIGNNGKESGGNAENRVVKNGTLRGVEGEEQISLIRLYGNKILASRYLRFTREE